MTIEAFHFIQGEEICVALQTHINDVMLRRYSKARSVANGSVDGDISNNFKPPSLEVYEKRVQDLSKAVEESQKNTNQVSFKRDLMIDIESRFPFSLTECVYCIFVLKI